MSADRRAELRAAGDRALRLVQPPHIGSRWAPGEAVRIDTSAGHFEHVNARVYSDADSLRLQRVLLTPEKPRGNGRIRSVLLTAALSAAFAAVLFYGSNLP
jgi:hypothetical protein